LEVILPDLRLLTSDDPERISAAYEAATSPFLNQAEIRSIKNHVEMHRDRGILVQNANATSDALPAAAAQETARSIDLRSTKLLLGVIVAVKSCLPGWKITSGKLERDPSHGHGLTAFCRLRNPRGTYGIRDRALTGASVS
jgi:hypothetical protein